MYLKPTESENCGLLDPSKKCGGMAEHLALEMENMGFLFEYTTEYLHKAGFAGVIDPNKFIPAFMQSRCRRYMETGHPMLSSQAAALTFRDFIEVDCKNNYKQFLFKADAQKYVPNVLYWVGYAYTYFHWHADMYSTELYKRIPLRQMLKYYDTGHTMDISACYARLKELGIFDKTL